MAEQSAVNRSVVGSNPTRGALEKRLLMCLNAHFEPFFVYSRFGQYDTLLLYFRPICGKCVESLIQPRRILSNYFAVLSGGRTVSNVRKDFNHLILKHIGVLSLGDGDGSVPGQLADERDELAYCNNECKGYIQKLYNESTKIRITHHLDSC